MAACSFGAVQPFKYRGKTIDMLGDTATVTFDSSSLLCLCHHYTKLRSSAAAAAMYYWSCHPGQRSCFLSSHRYCACLDSTLLVACLCAGPTCSP